MELDGRLFPIEMKCKKNLTRHDTRGLRAFRVTYGEDKVAPAIIVYAGHECFRLNETTTVIPWQAVQRYIGVRKT